MSRPVLALLLLVVFFGVNFGWRTWRHWRTTGSTGFRGFSGRIGSVEWFGGALFAVALVLGVGAPVAELSGFGGPHVLVKPWWVDPVAVAVVLLGMAGTSWAQAAMGASWRIGVKEDERTELIERGPFKLVRNPIFTSMLVSSAGLLALLPNALAVASFVAMLTAVELQVRFVEEPYLLRAHGERYASYTDRAGRFVPGLGKGLVARGDAR